MNLYLFDLPIDRTVRSVSFSVFFFLLLFGASANAQAVKVHEFEGTNCESQRADVDVLLIQLADSPSSKGVIVFHGVYNDPVTPFKQRATIINHLRFRKFDIDRIVFVLGERERKFRTELWKMTGDDFERFTGGDWDLKRAELMNPVIVHADSWLDGIGCGFYVPDLKFYSEFLIANENISGRVIIRGRSNASFKKIKTRIMNELITKYKVSKTRVEFAYIKDEWPDVEYWYLPSNTFPLTTMP